MSLFFFPSRIPHKVLFRPFTIIFKYFLFTPNFVCSQARGASLVERHRDDTSKAKKSAGKAGEKKSFSWSREEDFEQRRQFTPQVKKGVFFP